MESWRQDLRYALVRLAKSPAFSLIAVFTLAIGIGATTAMFSVVQNVLLRPLRYPDPQRLVVLRERISTPKADFWDLPVNANHLLFWRDHNRSFTELAALLPGSMPIGGEQTEVIGVAEATASLVSTLGFEPQLGRTLTEEEEKPGHKVILLMNSLWKRRFAADPAVVGKTVPLDGSEYLVIGVLPPEFTLPSSRATGGMSGTDKTIEALIPFGWTSEQLGELEGDHNYFVIGRLKPGSSPVEAAADLNSLQRRISEQTPDKVNLGARVISFQEYLVGSSRRALLLLLAAVSGVLLIACINITNLLLARSAGRGQESALRLALGASRKRLMSHALMEPLLLASTGCIVGTLVARVGLPLLLRSVPTELPRVSEVQINVPVLAFSLGVSILSALCCGILPAWHFTKGSPQLALRGESRTTGESRPAKHLRQVLVVGEVITSVMLVLLAGLFLTSLLKLLRVDRGFQTERVLSAEVALPGARYKDASARNAFYEQTLARLGQLPGVENAGVVSVLPLDGDNWGDLVSKSGDTQPLWQRPEAHFRWISPGYFETLRVPLIAGRFLTDGDRGKRVAIISRHVAKTVWPGQDAVCQRFTRGDPEESPIEVIGVVGDVRSLDLGQTPPRMVYLPYWYRSRNSGSLVVRTHGDPAVMASTLRKVIWGIDTQVAVPNIRTMETVVNGSVSARRFQMRLLLTFAVSSLLLAGLGIYGVVAYSALQRTQEIGIRMALGARDQDIYRLILSEGDAPVLVGTLLGVGLAWLIGHIVANLLFEVGPSNPLVAGTSCAILIGVGVIASFLPAWRAAKIEPVRALHYE
jgi:predicted permease